MQRLSKSFPGVRALRDVSLRVRSGSIHALVGENGAGKSTLVKIIAGIQQPDAGAVELSGRRVTRFTPVASRALGVGLVAQEAEHFADLTALENFYVGDWERRFGPVLDWQAMETRARQVLEDLGVNIPLQARMGDLPLAQRQMIQIGRALLLDARLLILDEPTAALGQAETDALFALVRRLAERGVGIIYISHRLDEVFELADEVTVLRDGELVDSLPVDGLSREDLVRMMVGSEVPASRRVEGPAPAASEAPPVLEVVGLGVRGQFEDVTLSVRPGEILGLAGLQGSGRNALAHALGGALRADAGEVRVDGANQRLTSTNAAQRAGIVLAPGDRHGRALVLPMTLRENITLSILRRVSRGPFPHLPTERQVAKRYCEELDIRATSLEQVTATLSGGNQQKVSLARRLAAEPRVLVLEEPTQGVDVGARAEIHRLLRELAAQGLAIVMVSSDMDEVLALSDRVAVMHRGKVAGILEGGEATKEHVLELAFGEGVESAASDQRVERAPSVWRRLLGRRELGLALVVIVAMVALALTTENFRTVDNFRDMALNSAYILVAALGMTMIILTSGIDISIGSMLALCCMAFGVMAQREAPIPLVVLGTLATGALLGAINAVGVGLMRLPPIIMTLATLTIYRGAVLRLGGGDWIQLPEQYLPMGRGLVLGVPIPVWEAFAALAVVAAVLRYTAFGRSLYAVGNNVQASEHLGISMRRSQLAVFTIGGLLVGLAALAYAPRFDVVQTNSGMGLEMLVITAVVVGGTNITGGRGSVLGTLLGVLLLTLISNALNLTQVSDYWEKAFQGVLVLAAVIADHMGRGRRVSGGEG